MVGKQERDDYSTEKQEENRDVFPRLSLSDIYAFDLAVWQAYGFVVIWAEALALPLNANLIYNPLPVYIIIQ